MLLFKNGCFYRGNISIQIPDGFYLEDAPEVTNEHGFCAWSPRKDFLCSWKFYEDCKGTEAELSNWFIPDCGLRPLSKITEIRRDGLLGHCVFYKSDWEQYYETRFDLGEGEQLAFLVETQGRDIYRIAQLPEFQAALEGIRTVK